ncbi:hypothetical protein O9993_12995 [Vibrio lentus]|nr:hypothetical protein [Vibrio lentus]
MTKLKVKVTVVPILRRFRGMMDGVLEHIPSARISVVVSTVTKKHLSQSTYFNKLASNIDERIVVSSRSNACDRWFWRSQPIDLMKEKGCGTLRLMLVAAPKVSQL